MQNTCQPNDVCLIDFCNKERANAIASRRRHIVSERSLHEAVKEPPFLVSFNIEAKCQFHFFMFARFICSESGKCNKKFVVISQARERDQVEMTNLKTQIKFCGVL